MSSLNNKPTNNDETNKYISSEIDDGFKDFNPQPERKRNYKALPTSLANTAKKIENLIQETRENLMGHYLQDLKGHQLWLTNCTNNLSRYAAASSKNPEQQKEFRQQLHCLIPLLTDVNKIIEKILQNEVLMTEIKMSRTKHMLQIPYTPPHKTMREREKMSEEKAKKHDETETLPLNYISPFSNNNIERETKNRPKKN